MPALPYYRAIPKYQSSGVPLRQPTLSWWVYPHRRCSCITAAGVEPATYSPLEPSGKRFGPSHFAESRRCRVRPDTLRPCAVMTLQRQHFGNLHGPGKNIGLWAWIDDRLSILRAAKSARPVDEVVRA